MSWYVHESIDCKWSIKVNHMIVDDLTFEQVVDRVFVYPGETIGVKLSATNDPFQSLQNYPHFVTAIQTKHRLHKRVPLIGTATLRHALQGEFQIPVRDISIGGIGLKYQDGIENTSDEIDIVITSDKLTAPLLGKAKIVQMIKERHILNLKFITLHQESQHVLAQYIELITSSTP